MVPPGGNTRERFPDFKAVPAASARGLFGGGSQPFSTKLNLIEFIILSTDLRDILLVQQRQVDHHRPGIRYELIC